MSESKADVRASRQIGSILRERGVLTQVQLEAALAEQRVTREKLGLILTRNGFVPRSVLVNTLMEVSPTAMYGETVFSAAVPDALLRQLKAMIVSETATQVHVATLTSEKQTRLELARYYAGREIHFVPAAPDRITAYLSTLSGVSSNENLLETLVRQALSVGASDIHIVPRYASYSVFFRRMGVRYLAYEGSLDELLTLTARIKDRAHVDLAERRVAQDGAFQVAYNGRLVDMRVVTVPTTDGEYIVMRLLDPDRIQPDLNKLGIDRVDHWRAGVNRPDGLCLVCGPTGSGKSTTLNSTVRELDRFGSAIFTVEDPVEYRIAYAGQVNVNAAVGMDFARTVRAFMRSDPDVIVLGEVRDPETAANAVKAAETGHLVLATLHTGTIHGAAQRLRDLGIPPSELVHVLRSVLVQRLIRVVCKQCGGEGCPHCGGHGYTGRAVVAECAYFSTETDVRRMLDGERWWPTMLEDAVGKVAKGDTTLNEVKRMFGEEEVVNAMRRMDAGELFTHDQ